MEPIFIFALFILIAVFVVRMIIDLIANDISVLAKIIWFLVILAIPLLGATLYYVTEKRAS